MVPPTWEAFSLGCDAGSVVECLIFRRSDTLLPGTMLLELPGTAGCACAPDYKRPLRR